MKRISWRYIRKQLFADLIGKDSYRGVTLTYSWLANQFGHFALGSIPTLIVYTALSKRFDIHKAALYSAVIVSGFWLLFETYNFLGPLILKKHSKSKYFYVPRKAYTFQPDWQNVAFDTITDLIYFWFGAFFVANIICGFILKFLIILLFFLVLALYPSYYWFLTKIYVQIPQYPYQFRLSQWDFDMVDEDKRKVFQFLKASREGGQHLFIFGSKNSGKTSLSVALATELSINHKTCIYTTAVKLFSMFFEQRENGFNEQSPAWSWHNCSTLVIDDINPGRPINPDLVSSTQFLKFLDAGSAENISNRKVLRDLNTIWVLGSQEQEHEALTSWKNMLVSVGVKEEKIVIIDLGQGKI